MERNSKPDLFYEEFGQGDPLLLLHGLAVTGDMFFTVIDRLSRNHRLIVPDLRGHGRSESLSGPFSPKQMSEDVAELLDYLGIALVDILGYAEGGVVAQQFAKDNHGRVNKLILVCSFAYSIGTLSELVEAGFSPMIARIAGIKRLGRLALGLSGGPKLSRDLLRRFENMLPTDPDKIARAIRETNRFDSRPWLHQIKAETLVIAGSDDRAVPLYHAETLARGIEHAQLRVISGAGHFLILTHHDELVDMVEEFLKEPQQSIA